MPLSEDYIDMTEPEKPISRMVCLEEGTPWQMIKNYFGRKKC